MTKSWILHDFAGPRLDQFSTDSMSSMTLWLTNAGHKRSQMYCSESFSHVRWSAMWAPPWNAIPELCGALRGHVICPMSADSHRLRNWRWAKSGQWNSKSWNCTSNFGLRVHQSRWEGRKLGNYGTLDPHIEENIVFLENSEITAMATFSNFARTPQVLWLLRLLEQNWSQMSCRHMAPCPVPPVPRVARAAAPPDQLGRRKAPCRQGHGACRSRRHVAGNFVSKQRMRFWCFLRFLRFRWQNRYPCIAVIVTWLSFWPLLSSTRLLLQSCAPKVLCEKHDPERSCFCCPGMTWLACGHSPQKASKSKEEWLEDLRNDFVISCPSMASGSRPVVCSAFWTAWRRLPFAAPVMAPSSRGDRPEARNSPSKDYVRRNSIRTEWRGWTMLNRDEPWWTWWNWVIFQSSLCSVIEVMRQGTQTIFGVELRIFKEFRVWGVWGPIAVHSTWAGWWDLVIHRCLCMKRICWYGCWFQLHCEESLFHLGIFCDVVLQDCSYCS